MRRPERLAESLREEITEIVGYELEDPRLEAVTVTEVRVSPDLRDAKVFVLIEGDESEIREAMKALHNAEKFVRSQVAMNLNINHAPHIHFARDTVEEKAERIELLLEELKNNDESNTENDEVK
jgi:ribosome-binding factor A